MDDFNEIIGDSFNKKFGFGFKRKVLGIWYFFCGCGIGVLGYSDDYLDEEDEFEYLDWFGMIDFEEYIIED